MFIEQTVRRETRTGAVLANEQRFLCEALECDVLCPHEPLITPRGWCQGIVQYCVRPYGFAFRRVGQQVEIVGIFTEALEHHLPRAHIEGHFNSRVALHELSNEWWQH